MAGSRPAAGLDADAWAGRRVFVTGHTGFKGSWLCLLLARLGAQVSGYALDPPSQPNLFEAAGVENGLDHVHGDVRDLTALTAALRDRDPEIVIHMAAQALVRPSYDDPVGTYETNVMGTVNVLEAVRGLASVRAVLIVTSDKCYENVEQPKGYHEGDPMGGHDPYSSSKGCAELVTAAYRNSFFSGSDRAPLVASARAGNVVGGGDWGLDRLVPDLIRAFHAGTPAVIRRPDAIRPWQFVLDPLGGYLMLAEHLWRGDGQFAEAWNFGPHETNERPVRDLVRLAAEAWGPAGAWTLDNADSPHEAHYLKLDVAKAKNDLNWQAQFDLERTMDLTVTWYKTWAGGGDVRALALAQVDAYLATLQGRSS